MKKMIYSFVLLFILPLTTNAIAKCDLDYNSNVTRHGEVDPETGRGNSELHIFSFHRDCDTNDKSCSSDPEVLVTSDNKADSMSMYYKVHAWFAQMRVYGKNNFYQIKYWDKDSKSYCMTSIKQFE